MASDVVACSAHIQDTFFFVMIVGFEGCTWQVDLDPMRKHISPQH